MARKVAAMPPAPARNARRLIPSFLAAPSASCLARASTLCWSSVWGMGMYSPFDTSWVGIGENGSAASALAHLASRSEEHTSELQSLAYLVCRLLLEKKKKNIVHMQITVLSMTDMSMWTDMHHNAIKLQCV